MNSQVTMVKGNKLQQWQVTEVACTYVAMAFYSLAWPEHFFPPPQRKTKKAVWPHETRPYIMYVAQCITAYLRSS